MWIFHVGGSATYDSTGLPLIKITMTEIATISMLLNYAGIEGGTKWF